MGVFGVRGGAMGVGWRKRRVEDVGAEREVEDEKAGGRGEMKRERIHNE